MKITDHLVLKNDGKTPWIGCEYSQVLGPGLRLSVTDRRWQGAAQFLLVREEAPPHSREGRGSADRGRAAFRASQSPPLTQQLACEQGEGGTQDRAGHPASQQDTNDARSLHAGRQRRDEGSARRFPPRGRNDGDGAVNVWVGLWVVTKGAIRS